MADFKITLDVTSDGQGLVVNSTEVEDVTPPPPPPPPPFDFKVNVAGPASGDYEAGNGIGFNAGTGTANRGNIPIADTANDFLYQTERWGITDYIFPLDPGRYQVTLHMAETSGSINGPGERLFDVFINGNLYLENFDVFVEAGNAKNAAVVKSFVVDDMAGVIDITWIPLVQNAFVNAIEIVEVDPATALTNPLVPSLPPEDPEPEMADMETPSGVVRPVFNSAQFTSQYALCQPGDAIELASGTYNLGNKVLDRSGSAGNGNKIFIQAAEPGQVTILNSELRIEGDYNYVTGLKFDGCKILIGGNNVNNFGNRVTDCEMFNNSQNKDYAIEIEESSGNRVSYCEIHDWDEKGIGLRADHSTTVAGGQAQTDTRDNVIDHNYFHDFPLNNGNHENGTEPFQSGPGSNSYVDTRAIVEYNLFENTLRDGEIISNKTSFNIYRFNTATGDGNHPTVSFTMRHGVHSDFYGNWLDNVRIRCYGNNHRIVSNRIENEHLYINAGDGDNSRVPTGEPNSLNGGHPTAKRIDVVGNTVVNGDIFIGHTSQGSQNVEDCFVFGNNGNVVLNNEQNTRTVGPYNSANANNPVLPLVTPVKLTPADVGPRTF